tara:strand:+ start:982 stop:1683 length:702 start_codon:yes stop_codon:yes gene_type:complete
MANRTILQYPNPLLKKKSVPVESFNNSFAQEVKDLIDTLEVNRGAGLAAPQVGIHKRFLLLNPSAFDQENPDPFEFNEKFMLVVNPEMELSEEKINWPEACLSVREEPMQVVRSRYVKLKYQNLDGDIKLLDLEWPLSAALQHEYDHLDGMLYIDRISNLAKNRLAKARHKREKEKKALREKAKEEDILEYQGPAALRKYKMEKAGKRLSQIVQKKKKKRSLSKASKKKNRRK